MSLQEDSLDSMYATACRTMIYTSYFAEQLMKGNPTRIIRENYEKLKEWSKKVDDVFSHQQDDKLVNYAIRARGLLSHFGVLEQILERSDLDMQPDIVTAIAALAYINAELQGMQYIIDLSVDSDKICSE